MVKTKLLEGKTAAESSRYLAKIALDAPVSLEEEKFRLRGFDRRLVKPLLARLELKKILQKLDQIQQHLGGTPTLELTSDADSNQLSLFDLPPVSPPVLIAPDIIDTISNLAIRGFKSVVSVSQETGNCGLVKVVNLASKASNLEIVSIMSGAITTGGETGGKSNRDN